MSRPLPSFWEVGARAFFLFWSSIAPQTDSDCSLFQSYPGPRDLPWFLVRKTWSNQYWNTRRQTFDVFDLSWLHCKWWFILFGIFPTLSCCIVSYVVISHYLCIYCIYNVYYNVSRCICIYTCLFYWSTFIQTSIGACACHTRKHWCMLRKTGGLQHLSGGWRTWHRRWASLGGGTGFAEHLRWSSSCGAERGLVLWRSEEKKKTKKGRVRKARLFVFKGFILSHAIKMTSTSTLFFWFDALMLAR